MDEAKTIVQSKTLWFNAIALVVMVVQSVTGFEVQAEEQAGVVAIVNMILRFITRSPVKVA